MLGSTCDLLPVCVDPSGAYDLLPVSCAPSGAPGTFTFKGGGLIAAALTLGNQNEIVNW